MNIRKENSSNALTCWQQFGSSDEPNTVQKAAITFLCLFAICNIVSSALCTITTIATIKLRKPTWIFKASMAVKDIIFSLAMTLYAIGRIFIQKPSEESATKLLDKDSMFDMVHFALNVIFIMCLTSSFVHILLITFDRYQVIARPFRYHTGELLPSNVALVLVASGWVFSFVIGLSVTSQTLEKFELEEKAHFIGSMFLLYQGPMLQKWLLGAGMIFVYLTTAGLLISAFIAVLNRAKTRKAQLMNGVGELEPVRSRNNSLCHGSLMRRENMGMQAGANSEADANEFMLTAGVAKTRQAKRDDCNEEATIFTPVHYRPSLRRRIRDTWSLYSAMICFVVFTFMVAIPFLSIVCAAPSQIQSLAGVEAEAFSPSSYCVGMTICECLLMLQGFAYVTVYVIIDDVFRPQLFLLFKGSQCKRQHR